MCHDIICIFHLAVDTPKKQGTNARQHFLLKLIQVWQCFLLLGVKKICTPFIKLGLLTCQQDLWVLTCLITALRSFQRSCLIFFQPLRSLMCLKINWNIYQKLSAATQGITPYCMEVMYLLIVKRFVHKKVKVLYSHLHVPFERAHVNEIN